MKNCICGIEIWKALPFQPPEAWSLEAHAREIEDGSARYVYGEDLYWGRFLHLIRRAIGRLTRSHETKTS